MKYSPYAHNSLPWHSIYLSKYAHIGTKETKIES